MTKVLILAGAFTMGGVETVIMNILRNLKPDEFKFDIIAIRRGEGPLDEEIENMNIGLIKQLPIREVGIFNYCSSLCSVISKNKYDVIHINGVLSSAINVVIAKKCGIRKIIFHAHNTKDSMIDKINNRVASFMVTQLLRGIIRRFSDIKLACGKQAGEFVFGNLNNVRIINNAIDLTKFHFITYDEHMRFKKALCPKFNDIVIGNAARFTKVKNQIFLIKIVECLIKSTNTNISLLLAGDGEELAYCEEYVKKHNLVEHVHFLGNCNDMKRFYSAINIFVLTSLYEGLPVSAIEAQACGIPVLLSNTITSEADIGIDLASFLPLNNYEAWTKGILDVKDKRLYNNVYKNYESVLNKYGIPTLIDNILKVYMV